LVKKLEFEIILLIWKFCFFYLLWAQIQILGYNSELYQNMSEASNKPNGVVGIALLIQVSHSKIFNTNIWLSIRIVDCLKYNMNTWQIKLLKLLFFRLFAFWVNQINNEINVIIFTHYRIIFLKKTLTFCWSYLLFQ
jgi:hypothetical protein